MTFLTYDIFPFVPERPFDGSETNQYQMVGDDNSIREVIINQDPIIKVTLSFMQESDGERITFRDYFFEKFGRYSTFWLRSYTPRVQLLEDADLGALSINVTVTNIYLRDGYHKMVLYHDDAQYAVVTTSTEVQYSEELGEYTTIQLESSLTMNLKAGDWLEELYFCRFDTDTLTFNQIAYKITKTKLVFKELRQEMLTVIGE